MALRLDIDQAAASQIDLAQNQNGDFELLLFG
jgi:hypothetical protein